MRRILLGVDDSPAGLAAARAAVQLAAECSGRVLAVHVQAPSVGDAGARALQQDAARGGGLSPESIAVLRFAAGLAREAAVPIELLAPQGDPARRLLDLAAAWPADVIVLGRSAGRRVGQPYIGSRVQHVLEFCDTPVLVVPPPPGR
jgi:nucleotide-binding universal stress UspA family protein